MSILLPLIGFILTIAVVVTIHEGGHCLMAKLMGVKVLRFSLGMGPVVWRRRIGETEYCLTLLPLGGYVKMLGENDPDAEVAPQDRHRTYEAAARWRRGLIVFAGPAINFVLAFVLYAAIGAIGTPDLATVMGTPPAQTQAAAAGVREGDRLVEVDGERVNGMLEVSLVLMNRAGDADIPMTFLRDGTPVIRHFSLAGETMDTLTEKPAFLRLGLLPHQKEPMISAIVGDSPAARAGLAVGDRILSVNGVTMTSVGQVVRAIGQSPSRVEMTVASVKTPEEVRTLTVVPEMKDGRALIGVSIAAIPEFVRVRLSPADAVIAGYRKVERMTMLQVKGVGQMATGEASTKNISGPIAIADMAGSAVKSGVVPFLEFIALISVAIGFMNLLPIPMLDGGQLVVLAMEGLRRKDFSEDTREKIMKTGFVLLMLIFVFAMGNDLTRLLG